MDSSVSIVTMLWAGRPMSRGSNPGRWFSDIQQDFGPPHLSLLFQDYLNLFPPGRVKRPELGANYTSSLVQRLGMSGAVPSLHLYAFVSCKGTSLSLRFSLFLFMTALLPFCARSADFLSLLLLFPSVCLHDSSSYFLRFPCDQL
jgi:hypothetical protein